MRSAAVLAAVLTLLAAAPALAKPDRKGARAIAAATTQLRPAPTDICTQLGDWRDRGYPADAAPRIEDPGLDALLDDADSVDSQRLDRAARRLRRLGVSRRIARVFRGDDDALYDGIDLGGGELHIGEANR